MIGTIGHNSFKLLSDDVAIESCSRYCSYVLITREGTPWNFWWGCAAQTHFQTKKCDFPHPFSDLASKIHTRFQT